MRYGTIRQASKCTDDSGIQSTQRRNNPSRIQPNNTVQHGIESGVPNRKQWYPSLLLPH